MATLSFFPSKKSITVADGTTLLAAVRQAGFSIPASCGGKGLCGKCRVKIIDGAVPIDYRQRFCLSSDLLEQGWRASCIVEMQSDLIVADPDNSAGQEIILTDFHGKEPDGEPGWDSRLISLEKAKTAGDLPLLVLAVDLGTTTLAAVLCDMANGSTLAVVSAANPQAKYGDDVISRAEYASGSPEKSAEMRLLAVDAVNSLAAAAIADAGVSGWPACTTIAANPVMNHLLLGLPCQGLTTSPFVPVFRRGKYVTANPSGQWYILPNISAYVGGDIVAGLLAHSICDQPGHTLFLDVGTNGEMVLVSNGTVSAAAAAAGPAFEGARIRQGMRASPGAVAGTGIDENGRLRLSVIDGRDPRGICGTGLLSAVNLLLREGIIDDGGKMRSREEVLAANPEIPIDLLARIFRREGENGETAFWLARPGSGNSEGVALTQQDVREFQLAKGAMAAGAALLLADAGVEANQLDGVVLAGGFGSYLDPAAATGTGLIPPGVPAEKIHAVGNSSLAGARLCLLSRRDRELAEQLADRVGYIELSTKPSFQMAFAQGMMFPSP